MNYYILTYIIYLAITIVLTIYVARILFKNGRVFLIDIFHQNMPLADAVNKLLLVGFYLINIGYISITLQDVGKISDYQSLIEELSAKVGYIILILGGMHFLNLFIFFNLRKRSLQVKR